MGLDSYRGTAGQASTHPCLTINEVLSHFGERRSAAQEKYREYVSEGIGQVTIWENLEAQSLLGLEGFADALKGHVTGQQKLREIPKEQRLIGRASLKRLFEQAGRSKPIRDRLIAEAVYRHGYSQVEVARHLGLHYSTVSRLMKSVHETARVKT
jgi:REP-associated tyrosine transposase